MLSMLNRLSNARILVVEDSHVSQEFVVRALAKAGFKKIETAEDGIIALNKTRQFAPDLVILDLMMPNLDGFGYCEQVRNDTDLPRMPIIVQTMLEDRKAKLRALSCGADDYLNKPIDADEINLRVCNQLKRYFAMLDSQEMCEYLKLELQHMRNIMQKFEKLTLEPQIVHTMLRHCEVLEEMTILPTFEN